MDEREQRGTQESPGDGRDGYRISKEHNAEYDVSDETQLLTPEEQLRIRHEQHASGTGHVRELPRRDAYGAMQPEQYRAHDGMQARGTEAQTSGSSIKKWVLVGGVFIVALAAGFMLSDSAQEKERTRQEQAATVQDLESRQRDMERQGAELAQQKAALEQKKAELAAKERELEKEEARLAGKGEQLTQEQQDTTAVGSVIDKITGKEEAREKERAAVEADILQMRDDLQVLRDTMQDTDMALQQIDSQLSALSDLAENAKRATDAAKDVYAENEEVIDSIFRLIERAADLLRGVMTSR